MTNIADLLRLVPGLSVAGSKWAVTSRGFNARFANKLPVLVDGRSVYTPIFSGVYWDMSLPLLDDIDCIEVIRGPGLSVSAGGGTSERAFGQASFGGNITGEISYRGYLSGSDNGTLQTLEGEDGYVAILRGPWKGLPCQDGI